MKSTDNYLHETNLRSLYSSAEKWQSQTKFFDDEIKFLHLLIDKYIIWLASGGMFKAAQTLAGRLKKGQVQFDILDSAIRGHMKRLAVFEKKSVLAASKIDLKRHADLENDLVGFLKSFHELKRDIFDLAERVSRSEKVKAIDKLLSRQA